MEWISAAYLILLLLSGDGELPQGINVYHYIINWVFYTYSHWLTTYMTSDNPHLWPLTKNHDWKLKIKKSK